MKIFSDTIDFSVKIIFSASKYLDELVRNEKTNLQVHQNIKKAEEIIFRDYKETFLSNAPKCDKVLFIEAMIVLKCAFGKWDDGSGWKIDGFKFVEFDIKHKESLNEIAFLNY